MVCTSAAGLEPLGHHERERHALLPIGQHPARKCERWAGSGYAQRHYEAGSTGQRHYNALGICFHLLAGLHANAARQQPPPLCKNCDCDCARRAPLALPRASICRCTHDGVAQGHHALRIAADGLDGLAGLEWVFCFKEGQDRTGV